MLSESEFFADGIDLLCILANVPVIQLAVFAVSEIVISVFAAGNRPFGKLPNHGFLLKYHLFVANSLPLNHGIDQHRSQPSRQSRHSFTILPAPYRRALCFIIPHKMQNINGCMWYKKIPFCQTASAFRLICLFHTFFRCGAYRAMVFAPLRCPKLF